MELSLESWSIWASGQRSGGGEGGVRFGAVARIKLQGCQMRKYPAGYYAECYGTIEEAKLSVRFLCHNPN